MQVLENELGPRLSVEEVANYLGLDEKTVRQYYRELGGMRLGRLFLFFERSVLNALQKRTEMDCPSAEGREETGRRCFRRGSKRSEWEAKMLRKPVSDWNVKTVTVCLGDWAQAYLDVAKARFVPASYKEKLSMFKRFFTEIRPELPVANLKPGDVLTYIVKQMEVRVQDTRLTKTGKTSWQPGTGG